MTEAPAQGPSPDRLLLHDLRFRGHHGVSAAERAEGGEFLVDLEVEAELEAAIRSDDVADTIDYVRLYQLVKEVVEGDEFHLVEALAGRICEQVLELPGAKRVRLRVTKPPRLPGQGTGFAVELVRTG